MGLFNVYRLELSHQSVTVNMHLYLDFSLGLVYRLGPTSAAYLESCSAAVHHNGVASLMAPNLAKGLTLIISAPS